MKRFDTLFLLAPLALTAWLAPSASAATTHYLYYVGGGVDAPASADPALDGTPTGDNGVFSTWVADVDVAAGTVTNWRRAGVLLPEDNPNTPGTTELYSWMFLGNAVRSANGYLYAGPGDWNGDTSRTTADLVAYAKINPDGSLTPWQLSSEFPSPPAEQAIGATALATTGGQSYYYVLGGNQSGYTRVLYSSLDASTGATGVWTETSPLLAGDWFNRATVVGSTIVHGTGNLATRDITTAAVNADGSLGTFTSRGGWDTAAFQWDYVMVTATAGGNDFALILGGAPNPPSSKVYVSQVTGGAPGAWTTTTDLPVGIRRVTGTAVQDLVFVCGGTITDGSIANAQDTIYIGRINASGQIASWTTGTPMPQKRAFGGAAIVPIPVATPTPVPPTGATTWSIYK